MLGSFRCRLRAVLETKIWKTWNTTDYSWRNKNCSINHYFIVRIRWYGRCSRKLEGRYMSIKVFHCWMNNFCISTQKLERVVRVSWVGKSRSAILVGLDSDDDTSWLGWPEDQGIFDVFRIFWKRSIGSSTFWNSEISQNSWDQKIECSKTKLVTLPRTKNFPTSPRRNNYWVPNSPLAWLHCR